ncbi:MAG: hypothetical protein R3Y29_01415 [bacterium]
MEDETNLPAYIFKRWVLTKGEFGNDFGIIVWGNVFENPRFCNGTMIHTTVVREFDLQDECIVVKTRNSVYHCYLKDCDTSDYKTKEVLCEMFEDKKDYFEDLFKDAIELPEGTKANHFERDNIELDKSEINHEEIENMTYIVCIDWRKDIFARAIFIKNEFGELENSTAVIHPHYGMFTDTALCQDYTNGLDYRFYVYFMRIEAYSKSFPNKYNFVVLNIGNLSVEVEHTTLKPNEFYKYK